MKNFLSLLIFILSCFTLSSQKLEHFLNYREYIDFVHIDNSGNSYICGDKKQRISKFSDSNELLWSLELEGASVVDRKTTVTTDQNGNVYWAGSFHSTIDVDLTENGVELYAPNSPYHHRGFIFKLSPDGEVLWHKIIEPDDSIEGNKNTHLVINAIEIDENDKIYIFGASGGELQFDNELGEESFSNGIFISQLDTNSNEIWTNYINSDNTRISGNHINLGETQNGLKYKNGYLYFTSEIMGTGTYTLNNSINSFSTNGNYDVITAKISSTGDFQWVNTFGGTEEDKGVGIDIDNDGNVYTCGYFYGTVDFDPSDNSHNLITNTWATQFLQKVDQNGNFAWTKAIRADKRTGGYSSYGISDIAIQTNGTILLAGKMIGGDLTVYDHCSTTTILSNPNSNSIYFLELYPENGLLKNNHLLENNILAFKGINVINNNIQIFGECSKSQDLDFSNEEIHPIGDNYRNAFISEYNLNYSYQTKSACDSYEFYGTLIEESGTYTYETYNENNEKNTITLYLSINKTQNTNSTIYIAPGDDFLYYNTANIEKSISENQITNYNFESLQSCDSIVSYQFILDPNAEGGNTLETAKNLNKTGYYNVQHVDDGNVFYKITPESTGEMTISNLKTSTKDTSLKLYDLEGNLLTSSDDHDGGFDDLQSQITWNVTQNNPIIIEWTNEYLDEWPNNHYHFEISIKKEDALSTEIYNKTKSKSKVIAIYDILGKPITENHKGIIIYLFDNGSSIMKIKK